MTTDHPSTNACSRLTKPVAPIAVMGLALTLAVTSPAWSAEELNVLAWCDHTDPATFEPFEQLHGVTVNVKEFEGTGTAMAIIEQSQPGDWDVMALDMTDVKRFVELGLFAPLNENDYPWKDMWPEIRMPEAHVFDEKLYGVPEKFGYNWIAFNNKAVDVDDMRNPSVLWDPKYKGRVALFDYYFTTIQTIAVAMGINPLELTVEALPAIQEKLAIMKENAAMIGDIVTIQSALATGEVDIVIGGAEFIVSGLSDDRPDLDWVLSDAGGLRWAQSMAIFAQSERKGLATEFLKWNVSPEGQALLAMSSCFWGMPVNTKAELPAAAKKVLRWNEQEKFLATSYPYVTPSEALDEAMIEMWAETLQN